MGINRYGVVAFALGVMLMGSAFGHDHDSANDAWYKSLTSQAGGSCCDGSDAFSVVDPDWEPTSDPKKPYRVKVEGWAEWIEVDAGAVVNQSNKVGVAKVWPVWVGGHESGYPMVRCFLPGAGA